MRSNTKGSPKEKKGHRIRPLEEFEPSDIHGYKKHQMAQILVCLTEILTLKAYLSHYLLSYTICPATNKKIAQHANNVAEETKQSSEPDSEMT